MNEFDFIATHLRPLVKAPEADGLRDDVAILPSRVRPAIVTTDTIVERVHFRAEDPLDTVAKKLIRTNVSDCLAKGAKPFAATLNIVWSRGRSEADLMTFVSGMSEDLETFQIDLLGGDTTSTLGGLVFSLTLYGECVSESGPVRRSGAQVNDDVWVTGSIGDAALGLKMLKQSTDSAESWLCNAYLVPNLPAEGVADLVNAYANASMDVSDGLIADATHLVEASEKGIELTLERVPVSEAAKSVLQQPMSAENLLKLCAGGDDYQALFTAPLAHREAVLKKALADGIALTRIGSVVNGPAELLLTFEGRRVEPPQAGWQHFMFS
ncbi:thiamine-phosphate kinase [Ponticaulis profundi]|uniref:Thiamine-monophosphate kinase n=1 Tax=Ponticaulis profundi TaxID=2665222 RepID=A0ABW1SB73_9PROT